MWKVILVATFFTFCVSEEIIEKDPSYPLEQLENLNLWKYNFPTNREKRSTSEQYLQETKLCDSSISFKRPQKLRNANNKWRTIVNHANYTQYVRFEVCSSLNFPCTYNIYPQPVRSFCQQSDMKLSLWAFDTEANCLIMDKFLIPSTCDCIIEKEDFFRGISKNLLRP
jgi:hypothetical protein